jgi:hypothetical protein
MHRRNGGRRGAPQALACALLTLGLLLPGLFALPGYHDLYWSHPFAFAPLTGLGAGAALGGGFLAGRSVRPRPSSWLRGLGACLALLGSALGLAALLLALSIADTGYWGAVPRDYGGDYLVLLLQIRLSQAAALPAIAGGLLLGLAYRRH